MQGNGGSVIVRLNAQNTPLELADARPVVLLDWLGRIGKPGQVGAMRDWLPALKGATRKNPRTSLRGPSC